MTKQVYKELQDQNNAEFKENPSTVSTSSDNTYNFGSLADKVKQTVPQTKGNSHLMDKLSKDQSQGGMSADGTPNTNEEIVLDNKLLDRISKKATGTGDFDGPTIKTSTLDSDFFDTKILGVNIGTPSQAESVYNPFSGFNVDQEDFNPYKAKSDAQSNVSKTINIGTQFVGKTAINTVGGIVGGFYSVGAAGAQAVKNRFLEEGEQTDAMSLLFDNSVNRALDKATEAVEKGNTVNTFDDPNKSWANNFFSFNTIKGLSDAASFIAGAISSELIMQTAGNAIGGMGLISAPARWLRLAARGKNASVIKNFSQGLNKVTKEADLIVEATTKGAQASKEAQAALKYADDFAKQWGYVDATQLQGLIGTQKALSKVAGELRSTVTGTFWEAGLEARQAKDGFIEHQMAMKERELKYDNTKTDEEKREILENLRKDVEELGNSAGKTTFGLNVAVLKFSNAIQFPAIFGKPYAKRLNKATAKSKDINKMKAEMGYGGDPVTGLVRDATTNKVKRLTLKELAAEGPWLARNNFMKKLRGKAMQAQRVGGIVGRFATKPLVEGFEEYSQYLASQSSMNYYGSVIDAMHNNDPRVNDGIGGVGLSFFQSFMNSVDDTFHNKAQNEFLIGAIMGAAGVPMFRKGANGKTGLQMQGGIFEEVRAMRAEKAQRDKIIDLYDPEKWNEAVAANLRRGAFNGTLTANASDLADAGVLTNNRGLLTSAKEDMMFNTVFEKISNDNMEFLLEDMQTLQDIDLNTPEGLAEFNSKYMNAEDLKNVSPEEQRKQAIESRDSSIQYMNRIIDTYNQLAPGLKADVANSPLFETNMLRFLTYSTVNAEHKANQIQTLAESISAMLNSELSVETIKELAELETLLTDMQSTYESNEGEHKYPFLDYISRFNDTIEQLISPTAEESGAKTIIDAEIDPILSNKRAITRLKKLYTNLDKVTELLNELDSNTEYIMTRMDPTRQAENKAKVEAFKQDIVDILADQEVSNTTNEGYSRLVDKIGAFLNSTRKDVLQDFLDAQNSFNSRQGFVDAIKAEGKKLLPSDLDRYFKLIKEKDEALGRFKKNRQLTPEDFAKKYKEEDLDTMYSEVAHYSRDQDLHRRVAGFLYQNIGNPRDITRGMFSLELGSMLGDMNTKYEAVLELILLEDTDEEIIKAKLTLLKGKIENLLTTEEEALTLGFDFLKNPEYKEYRDELIRRINALLKKYNMDTVTEKQIETINNSLSTSKDDEEEVEEEVENEDTEEDIAKGKRKKTIFNKVANLLRLNLNHYNKEQQERFFKAILEGKIKTNSVVELIADLDVITDEWMEEAGIPEDKREMFKKGFEAFKKNPKILDAALDENNFGADATGRTLVTTQVRVNGKVYNTANKTLASIIKAASPKSTKKASKSKAELSDTEALIKELSDKIVEINEEANQLGISLKQAIKDAKEGSDAAKKANKEYINKSKWINKVAALNSSILEGQEYIDEVKELLGSDEVYGPVINSILDKYDTTEETETEETEEDTNVEETEDTEFDVFANMLEYEDQELTDKYRSIAGILISGYTSKNDEYIKEQQDNLDKGLITQEFFDSIIAEREAYLILLSKLQEGASMADILKEINTMEDVGMIAYLRDTLKKYAKDLDANRDTATIIANDGFDSKTMVSPFKAKGKAKPKKKTKAKAKVKTVKEPVDVEVTQAEVDAAKKLLSTYNDLNVTAKELAIFLKVEGNTFKEVLGKIEADPDSDLHAAVRYFVGNYRLNTNFTDAIYNAKGKNKPGNTTFESFMPAVKDDIYSQEYIQKISKEVDGHKKEIADIDKELTELYKDENRDEARVAELQKKKKDIQATIEVKQEFRNDRTNLKFRAEALKKGKTTIKAPTISFGNLVPAQRDNERIEGANDADGVMFVKEFELLKEDGSGIVKDIDDFLDNVRYVTSAKDGKRQVKDIYGATTTVTRDGFEGYEDVFDSMTTGTTFFMYENAAGQRIPIKLNHGNLGTDTATDMAEYIKNFLNGDMALADATKSIDTYMRVRKKRGVSTTNIPNTIGIIEEKAGDRTVIFYDREGKALTITKDNFKEVEAEFILKASNTRANIFVGNIVDNEGNPNTKAIERVLKSKQLNTSIDSTNAFDKIYEGKDDGTMPKNLSISLTPLDFSNQKKKTTKASAPTSGTFREAINAIFQNDPSRDYSPEDQVKALTNKVLYSISGRLQTAIDDALTEQSEEVKKVYAKYLKHIASSDKTDFDSVDENKLSSKESDMLDKFLDPIFKDVVSSVTDMYADEYGGNTNNTSMFKIFNLKNNFANMFDENKSNTDPGMLVNAIFNQIGAIGKSVLKNKKNARLMLDAAIAERQVTKIKKVLENKMSTNKNSKEYQVTYFDNEKGAVTNEEAKDKVIEYVKILELLYKKGTSFFVDGSLPIAVSYTSFWEHTAEKKKKGKVKGKYYSSKPAYRESNEKGGIQYISINKDGEGVFFKMEDDFAYNKPTEENAKTHRKGSTNIKFNTPKGFNKTFSFGIPILSAKEIDDITTTTSAAGAAMNKLKKNLDVLNDEQFMAAMNSLDHKVDTIYGRAVINKTEYNNWGFSEAVMSKEDIAEFYKQLQWQLGLYFQSEGISKRVQRGISQKLQSDDLMGVDLPVVLSKFNYLIRRYGTYFVLNPEAVQDEKMTLPEFKLGKIDVLGKERNYVVSMDESKVSETIDMSNLTEDQERLLATMSFIYDIFASDLSLDDLGGIAYTKVREQIVKEIEEEDIESGTDEKNNPSEDDGEGKGTKISIDSKKTVTKEETKKVKTDKTEVKKPAVKKPEVKKTDKKEDVDLFKDTSAEMTKLMEKAERLLNAPNIARRDSMLYNIYSDAVKLAISQNKMNESELKTAPVIAQDYNTKDKFLALLKDIDCRKTK